MSHTIKIDPTASLGDGTWIFDGATGSIADHVEIGEGVKILVPELTVGEYTKIHRGCLLMGDKPLYIGANCWVGEGSILDSMGGLILEDNVGVGAHSQLWTHIKHGDVVEGCRWHQTEEMVVGHDAWFVGHCIVSPVQVGPRSMALAGAVITHNMEADRTYAGVPAVDITDKVGPQFEAINPTEKRRRLQGLITKFEARHPEWCGKIWAAPEGEIQAGAPDDVTMIYTANRTYTKRNTPAEVAFRKMFPELRIVPVVVVV